MSHAFYPVCVRNAAAVYYYIVPRDYSRIKRFCNIAIDDDVFDKRLEYIILFAGLRAIGTP